MHNLESMIITSPIRYFRAAPEQCRNPCTRWRFAARSGILSLRIRRSLSATLQNWAFQYPFPGLVYLFPGRSPRSFSTSSCPQCPHRFLITLQDCLLYHPRGVSNCLIVSFNLWRVVRLVNISSTQRASVGFFVRETQRQ